MLDVSVFHLGRILFSYNEALHFYEAIMFICMEERQNMVKGFVAC